jgi:hypothetical protein
MDLSVLLPRRVAQVHAPSEIDSSAKENTQGRHYTPKSPIDTPQVLDPTQPQRRANRKTTPQLRKLG